MRTAKTLIRLGGCPGLSESALGVHSFCWHCHVAAHLTQLLLTDIFTCMIDQSSGTGENRS